MIHRPETARREARAAARHTPVATHHRTARVDGLDVLYREAGDVDAPGLLLLHGFPTSSHMFRHLIPRLAGSFHLVAPDYPAFGLSSMPDRARFEYTFDNLTTVVDGLLAQLGLDAYALYVMDYGAPVGFRLALRHPERVRGLVVQNGNAYEEGLGEFWGPIKAYWADGSAQHRAALHPFVEARATREQYETGVSDRSLLDPAAWIVDQIGLDRPGNREIQMDLFYDYRTNVALYPRFQAFFREHQPPTLIVWGKNDPIFPAAGAAPFRRDLPDAETHLLDTGHFALETHGEEIAGRIEAFFSPRRAPRRRAAAG
jgi:pimeloyl-ACP methyl ester carboxylesterase